MPDSPIIEINKVVCQACQGQGRINNNLCQICHGLGRGMAVGSKLYYVSLPITRASIFLRHSRERVFAILDGILLLIGALGLACFTYWLYGAVNTNTPWLTLQFWNIKNIWLGLFWLTALFDLVLIYRFSRRHTQSLKIDQEDWLNKTNIGSDLDWAEAVKGRHLQNAADALGEESLAILEKAYIWTGNLNQNKVTPLHVFYMLMAESNQVNNWLNRLTFDRSKLAEMLKHQIVALGEADGIVDLNSELKEALLAGYITALNEHRIFIESMDIILPLRQNSQILSEILFDLELDEDKLKNIVQWFNIEQRLQFNIKIFNHLARYKPGSNMDRAYTALATPLLDSIGHDLTAAAKYNQLPICVGRDSEMEQILSGLASGSAGVLIVGELGVGKRTLVGGLAQDMVMEKVPTEFQDKRLVEVDVARLIGGTNQAEAENRLMEILGEIGQSGNVVLYFPEFQNLLELAEILASALDQKQLNIVASITNENYHKFLENTPLDKLLFKVDLDEPDNNTAIQILESKLSWLESHFKVFFAYEALEQAVKETAKLDHDNYLPAKAIKLLEGVAPTMTRKRGKNQLISGADVSGYLSEQLNIPIGQASGQEADTLLNLEAKMHKRMVGQEEAVKMVAESLRRARTELREGKRPIASFLFLGPTGVGKTELAKTLAATYFGAETAMIRLDMSEYQGNDAVNKMIGTPEGLKGYLTEKVRLAPFALILLDEIEKANPAVLDLFLQVIDDGRLTDGTGKTIDFTNLILIATSNIGALAIRQAVEAGQDLEQMKKEIIENELLKVLRPEFVNRFDGVVLFKPLSQTDVVAIAKLMLESLAKILDAKGVRLQATESGVAKLAALGYEPEFGARPLRRVLQDRLENEIAKKMLNKEIGRRDTIIINEQGEIEVDKAKSL